MGTAPGALAVEEERKRAKLGCIWALALACGRAGGEEKGGRREMIKGCRSR